MSTHNIPFYDKIRNFFVFLSYLKKFVMNQKRVQISDVNKPSVFELLRFNCSLQS